MVPNRTQSSDLNTDMFFLTAIIFNFYTMTWVPFPLIEPELFDQMDRCVIRMNEINRGLESAYSAVRVICSETQQ
jgi:hypothetical protein